MKLEIDIPSIIYNDAKENRNYISLTKLEIAWKAIADGKPLEQEPTCMIDKSNFSQDQYKADLQSAYDCGKSILGKIRAEITALQSHHINDGYDDGFQGCRTSVLEIIDKYKGEIDG